MMRAHRLQRRVRAAMPRRARSTACRPSSTTSPRSRARRERTGSGGRHAQLAGPGDRSPDPQPHAPRRTRARRRERSPLKPSKARRTGNGADRRSGRRRIQHTAAANRDRWRIASQDETITAGQHGVGLEPQRVHTPTDRDAAPAIAAIAALTRAPRDPGSRRSRDETARARRDATAARVRQQLRSRRRRAASRSQRTCDASTCCRAARRRCPRRRG